MSDLTKEEFNKHPTKKIGEMSMSKLGIVFKYWKFSYASVSDNVLECGFYNNFMEDFGLDLVFIEEDGKWQLESLTLGND